MKALRFFIGFCCLFFIISADAMYACDQPYALCDTSPCVPIPGVKNKALCFCSLFKGYSVGNLTCNARAPFTDKDGREHVFSNYGLANVKLHKLMTCPSNSQWTFCLDKECYVNPRNTNIVICTCDIVKSSNFITFGGSCDTSTCSNTLYSAATVADINEGDALLMKVMNLAKSPVQYCTPQSNN